VLEAYFLGAIAQDGVEGELREFCVSGLARRSTTITSDRVRRVLHPPRYRGLFVLPILSPQRTLTGGDDSVMNRPEYATLTTIAGGESNCSGC
jgi:hypothetical protein